MRKATSLVLAGLLVGLLVVALLPASAVVGVAVSAELAHALEPAQSLDGGLAQTPPLGWNSWYRPSSATSTKSSSSRPRT